MSSTSAMAIWGMATIRVQFRHFSNQAVLSFSNHLYMQCLATIEMCSNRWNTISPDRIFARPKYYLAIVA
jgi:hypothetical protein